MCLAALSLALLRSRCWGAGLATVVLMAAVLMAAPRGAEGQDPAPSQFAPAGVKELVRRAEAGSQLENADADAPTYQLPIEAGRLLYRFHNDLPPAVESFLATHDRNADIFWDHHQGTLRTCLPYQPLPLAEPTAGVTLSDTAGLTRAVEAFIDRHAELIGVDSTRLGAPYVYPLLAHRVLVFPLTTPGGIAVRGGHVRVVVLEGGRVGLIKAFVARGIEDPPGTLLDQALVEEVAREEGWGKVRSARLEMAFPPELSGRAVAVWSLTVREPDGGGAELLVEAQTGELVGRVVVVKHFDGEGAAAGARVQGKVHTTGPRIQDKFQSPWLPADRAPSESVLEGVLTGEVVVGRDGKERLRTADLSDETGDFGFNTVVGTPTTRAFASLRSGHLEPCEESPQCLFVPVVQVMLYPSLITGEGLPDGVRRTVFPPNQVDLQGDQIIDIVEDVATDGPEVDLRFNAGPRKDSSSERSQAHWLQTYEAGRSITSFATSELQGFFGLRPEQFRHPPFLPVSPLCMIPMPLLEDLPDRDHGPVEMAINAAQFYRPPGEDCIREVDGKEVLTASVATGLLFSSSDRDPFALPWAGEQDIHVNGGEAERLQAEGKPATKVVEEVVPTILQHEVGHHIFFHLTQVHSHQDVRTHALEEGVADVLTAWANDDARIGFKRDARGLVVATAKAFSLDRRSAGDFRNLLRSEVAMGFWELRRELLESKNPVLVPDFRAAHFLLLGWLMLHHMEGPWEGQAMDRSRDLVSLLKFVDEFLLMGGNRDGNIANGTPHSPFIVRAFYGGSHFQEVPFVRGDANLDQRLDISDAVFSLRFLFGGDGETHDCRNAIDTNNDSSLNLTDPIWLLNFLFQGGPPPAAPWKYCGFDLEPPGEKENLGCEQFTCPR